MKQLKFGWAEIDITPREKIALDGEFFERVTNVVETPISVTAFAIEREEEQCIICSCDLVEIYANLTQEVRRRISDTTIKKECIIMWLSPVTVLIPFVMDPVFLFAVRSYYTVQGGTILWTTMDF